jgi:S-methylmethionine-dependent homocysteine/selenocysteine methylase
MNRIDRLMTALKPWPADAGLETAMIFHEGFELPQFASFVLLDDPRGRAALDRWFEGFLDLARNGGTGFVLDTATWRANMGWAVALGLDEAGIRRVNADAVAYTRAFRDRHETAALPIVVNGVIGPSGDGYRVDETRAADDAARIHLPQIQALAAAGADMVSAVTMTHVEEAVGIARAAQAVGLPHVLSFTLEVDGNLPSGQGLQQALAAVEAQTAGSALFYMVNCAHPSHFSHLLQGPMQHRIGGIRANASRLSHAELDAATELDDGNAAEFGADYAALAKLLPNLRLIGGCCGTDHRHVSEACHHLHGGASEG